MRYVRKSHVACLLFVFSTGRLAVPLQDMNQRARHVLFSAPQRGEPNKRRGAENERETMANIKLLSTLICTSLLLQVNARTITEIEKEISTLRDEYIKLQKNPIFIWGSKQQNLSEKQKCATALLRDRFSCDD